LLYLAERLSNAREAKIDRDPLRRKRFNPIKVGPLAIILLLYQGGIAQWRFKLLLQ